MKINKSTQEIAFFDILYPYLKEFLESLKPFNHLSSSLKDKLSLVLLKKLSAVAERSLQHELDDYIKNSTNEELELSKFNDQIKHKLKSNYPVLDNFLTSVVSNFTSHITNITTRFLNDQNTLSEFLNLPNQKLEIIDIVVDLGDDHFGQNTTLLKLSSGNKLIYKPRNINVTKSYNNFIKWINRKLEIDIKTFEFIDRQDYGWLEFVPYKESNSVNELKDYYFKAGVLLATSYILGSKDYHHENIIASGKDPMIIDHETIVQPTITNAISQNSFEGNLNITSPSVLESHLITVPGTNLPLGVAGFGSISNTSLTDVKKEVINPNTLESKRVTRFYSSSMIKKNVPIHNNKHVFMNDYASEFINGFENAYDLFSTSKKDLKSSSSPIQEFSNKEVRFVWRPTHVYIKILNYLRSEKYMSDEEKYKSKAYELLSKAYKHESMSKYEFIFQSELEQLLKGDIPLFNLTSTDHFLYNSKNRQRIFDTNCIENIHNRIDSLSPDNKQQQLDIINNSIHSKSIA
ncbi:type 2 lanthipeptide synthetase LanM [Aquimarina sp. 2201CG1-2-11]|uniref:type 2 lanthipeptide synthetase LanM n=1 Tax=Aquimarina discodermiae TaxID=3231043 RepID=UPI003462C6E8